MPRAPFARLSTAFLAPLVLLTGCEKDAPRSLEERLADQPGFWFEARRDPGLEARQRELAALGYSDGYVPAVDRTGVVVHDADRVQPGWNLYSSGHGPEALLMDMDGEVVHTWSIAYDELDGAPPMEHPSQLGWRRVRLLDDGSLLAIHDGLVLLRIDKDSNLDWVFPARAHHDLEVLGDGRIVTLTRRASVVDELTTNEPIVEDFVTVLSPDGELLEHLSLFEALRNSSFFAKVVDKAREPDSVQRLTMAGLETLDLLHANSVQWLDGSHEAINPAFARGRVLICLRELDALVVVDFARKKVVWFREGAWVAPHDPRLTDDGNLTIFDNMGHQGYTQILELDPKTGEELWAFRGDPPDSLFSMFCGAARRQPNGNTLVTESCNGRALEVTQDGDIAWAFQTPHRAGQDGELVAVLFEVERVSDDRVRPWLDR